MPTVYTPNNDVVEVDPIIVTGIRQVWYTEEPKEDVGTLPPVEGEDAEIGEGANDPPPDPLVDYPEPQSCEDVDHQLIEALQRKEFFDDLNGLIADVEDLTDFAEDIRELALFLGLSAIANLVDRYEAALTGARNWIGTRAIATASVALQLMVHGTAGRWDQHIADLRSLQSEWNCPTS